MPPSFQMKLLLVSVVVLLGVQIGLLVWMLRLFMIHKRILIPLTVFDRMMSDMKGRLEREKEAFVTKLFNEAEWKKAKDKEDEEWRKKVLQGIA